MSLAGYTRGAAIEPQPGRAELCKQGERRRLHSARRWGMALEGTPL